MSTRVTPINERALLNRRMACDYLSIGESTFKAFEASGDIKGVPLMSGKEKRYRRRDLDELVEKMVNGETKIDKTKRGE